nr:hypothetical protein [uncultured Methanobacterium sp.]
MSTVFILKTSPENVVEDYQKLMHLAKYDNTIPPKHKTILKLNLSWTLFYPACSNLRGN